MAASDATTPICAAAVTMGWAAGGVVSTATDLARWVAELYGGEVLSRETRDLMTTPNTVSLPEQGDYGLGAFYESDGEYTLFGHTGGIAGYMTYGYFLEDPAGGLVILSNLETTDLRVYVVRRAP